MRYLSVLLGASILLTGGCSAFIVHCGKDVGDLKTRDQVHAYFGKPTASGIEDGQPFEDFRTRQKISESGRNMGYGMGLAMSFGLIELVAFPAELYTQGKKTILGQHLRFTYDAKGRITNATLDGYMINSLFQPSPWEPKPVETPPDAAGSSTIQRITSTAR